MQTLLPHHFKDLEFMTWMLYQQALLMPKKTSIGCSQHQLDTLLAHYVDQTSRFRILSTITCMQSLINALNLLGPPKIRRYVCLAIDLCVCHTCTNAYMRGRVSYRWLQHLPDSRYLSISLPNATILGLPLTALIILQALFKASTVQVCFIQ